MPLLSVIMPTYNDEKYITTSIDAILNQDFQNFELIIINDCSPDNSENIVRRYMQKDKRIVYHKNEENIGPIKSFNKGAHLARGKYVYGASSDDKVLPGFFKLMVHTLETKPEYSIVTSNYAYFNDGQEDKIIDQPLDPYVHPGWVSYYSPEKLKQLYKKSYFWVPGSSSIFKLEDLKRKGYMSEEVGYSCDYVFTNSLALEKGLIYHHQPLAAMRILPPDKIRSAKYTLKDTARQNDNLISYIRKDPLLWDQFYSSTLLARTINSKHYWIFLKPKFWKICPKMVKQKCLLLWNKLFIVQQMRVFFWMWPLMCSKDEFPDPDLYKRKDKDLP